MKTIDAMPPRKRPSDFDLDDLLHPARAFGHPRRVVEDPDLTLNEKRAILASWASDACAVEAVPALRQAPGTNPVQFDDVMDALRALDLLDTGTPRARAAIGVSWRTASPACSAVSPARKAATGTRSPEPAVPIPHYSPQA